MMTTRLLQDAAQTTAYHTTAPAGLVLSAQQGPCLTYIHTSDSCNSHCSSVLLTTTMTPAVEAALSHNPKAGMQQCPDPEWVPLPGPHCGSSCSKSLGHTAGADALVYPQLVRLHAAALLDLSNLGLGGIPTYLKATAMRCSSSSSSRSAIASTQPSAASSSASSSGVI